MRAWASPCIISTRCATRPDRRDNEGVAISRPPHHASTLGSGAEHRQDRRRDRVPAGDTLLGAGSATSCGTKLVPLNKKTDCESAGCRDFRIVTKKKSRASTFELCC